jgi:hypothetical protein
VQLWDLHAPSATTLFARVVLRPFETEEFICNIESAFQRAGERKRAEKAVESAKSALMSAQAITHPRGSSLSETDVQHRLTAAQSKLDAALKSLESIKRRKGLISNFHWKTGKSQVVNGKLKESYQIVKDNAERRSILLRWILQQVPLIEFELNPARVAENEISGVGVQRGSKRSRADESNEERVSNRQRQDGESNLISDRRTRASTAKECESQLKRSYRDSINESSRRPKHSGPNYLSPHNTSDAVNPTSIGEPLPTQSAITQVSRATAARSRKARSAPRKTRSEAKAPARVVLDEEARVSKRGRRGGEFSNLSILGSPLQRRSTRMRKPPERFQ